MQDWLEKKVNDGIAVLHAEKWTLGGTNARMIKRKIFYSMVEIDKIVGLRENDGFEFEIDGVRFNAYKSKVDEKIYIIDADSGVAISSYKPSCLSEKGNRAFDFELVRNAKEKFSKSEILKKWKESRNNGSYQLIVETFKAYERAEFLRERQKEVARKEREV
jgi:hypothetical protein